MIEKRDIFIDKALIKQTLLQSVTTTDGLGPIINNLQPVSSLISLTGSGTVSLSASPVRDITLTVVDDGVRSAVGSYWYYGDDDKLLYGDREDKKIQLDLRQTMERSRATLFKDTKQVIHIIGREGGFENFTDFKNYVTDIFPTNKKLYDHAFDLTVPLNVVDRELAENDGTEFSDLDAVYNFYEANYESVFKSKVGESVLPNIYKVYSDIEKNSVFNGKFTIPVDDINISFLSKETTTSKFFTTFASVILKQTDRNLISTSLGIENNLVFLYDTEEILATGQEKKFFFPMYMDLEFSTGIATYFAEALSSSLLLDEVVSAIQIDKNIDTFDFKKNEAVITQDRGGRVKIENTPSNVSVRALDIEDWFDTIPKLGLENTSEVRVFTKSMKPKNELRDKISSTVFAGKIRSLLTSQDRSYKELLNGHKAYSETVLYKISKYVGQPTGTPVQEIFLPNFPGKNTLNYLDTQVKYGSKYSYVVSAYQLVLGTEYEYSNLKFIGEEVESETNIASGLLNLMDDSILLRDTNDLTNVNNLQDLLGGVSSVGGIDIDILAGAVDGDKSFVENLVDTTFGVNTVTQKALELNQTITDTYVDYGKKLFDAAVVDETDVINALNVLNSFNNVSDITKGLNIQSAPNVTNFNQAAWLGSFTDNFVVSTESRTGDEIGSIEFLKMAADEDPEERDMIARAIVTLKPSVKLFEVSYTMISSRMLDLPPIEPIVDFIPYKGINNQINLSMTNGVGSYTKDFIQIEASDQAVLTELKEAQKITLSSKIKFASDDVVSQYQIFRTTTQPHSYGDFGGKLIKIVNSPGSLAVFVDSIKPNVTYYYTFRGVDIHGHISNPSPVFKFQMLDDEGAILPTVQVIEMSELTQKPADPSKGFRRFLHVDPRLTQTMLDQEQSELVGAQTAIGKGPRIKLGLEDQALFGKKFKIRLTSQATRRKIDINVYFDREHIRSEVEVESEG